MTKLTYKAEKGLREANINADFNSYLFEGRSKSDAELLIMNKYRIFARSTVWAIRKRVASRLEKEQIPTINN
jgi:hypothetical protein